MQIYSIFDEEHDDVANFLWNTTEIDLNFYVPKPKLSLSLKK